MKRLKLEFRNDNQGLSAEQIEKILDEILNKKN